MLSYSLSQPGVSAVVTGCSSLGELQQALQYLNSSNKDRNFSSRYLYHVQEDVIMDIYEFSLAKHDNLYEILDFYRSLIGTPGCTWNLNYPNQDIVQSDIDSKSLYILRDKENVLIAVAAAGVSDELKDLQWSLSNPCDLARIGVTSVKQKQGIGTIMLKNIINAVMERGFDGIRMLVSKSNPAALALYNKNGFHLCGETFMYGIDFYCYEMPFSRT